MPERYGPWKTVYSRFRRWQQAGIWEQVLVEVQGEAADTNALESSLVLINGSNIQAHQHAAGAGNKGGIGPNAVA